MPGIQMKQMLYIIKKLSNDGKKPWLFDDLIDSFSSTDIKQIVFLVDFDSQFKFGYNKFGDVDVYSYPIKSKYRYLKILELLLANLYFCYLCFKNKKFWKGISVVSSSISSLLYLVNLCVSKVLKPKSSIVVIWDFFPIHHVQISHCPKILEPILKKVEGASINCFKSVGLMSDRNLDFFEQYFGDDYDGNKYILPIWGKNRFKDRITKTKPLNNTLKCIFGGQITYGRGIEQLIELSKRIDENKLNVEIDVYGDGPLKGYLRDELIKRDIGSLKYCGVLERNAYLDTLTKYDVGLIITVPNVSVPTYPSKVIDYLVTSTPTMALVEKSTDFGEIIENKAKCGFYADVENIEQALEKISLLYSYKNNGKINELKNNSYDFFKSTHDVNKIKDQLMAIL